MPLANIKLVEGVFSEPEKLRIITRVTEALKSITGDGLAEKTVVIVEEVQSAHWGIGGEVVTTENAKSLRAAD
jgi:4-oxalocrotonate tautomerase